MSCFIGGYVPGYRIRLNASLSNPQLLSFGSTGIATGRIIDAAYTQTTYNSASTGVQYYIQKVYEQTSIFGEPISINLTTSNSGVATIDQIGNTTYISPGNFNVIGSYDGNSFYQGQSVSIPLISYSGGLGTSITTSYNPDDINISNHVLVIYNNLSNNSISLKDYYTGHRPLFSLANILPISCPSGQEIISYSSFTNLIRQPIVNYLTGISGSKPIRYAVMMCDIPTRVSDPVNNSSVPYQLYKAYQQLGLRNGADYTYNADRFSLGKYQQNTILSTYINFGTYKDCTAYIDKISLNQTGVYLTGNRGNTGYYFEDAGGYSAYPTWVSGRCLNPLLLSFPSSKYVYRPNNSGHISVGSNLAGFCTWGANGGVGANYSSDGTFRWSGSNNWYIMHTIESFDGQRNAGQGCFTKWFASGAFGGLAYENCPVGAVGHVEEPYLYNTTNTGYFMSWQNGLPFVEVAWQSRITPYFCVFGDPFVIHG